MASRYCVGLVELRKGRGPHGCPALPLHSALVEFGYEVLSNLEYHDLFLSLESPRGVIRRGGNKLFSFPEDAGMVNSVCMWKRVA
jgi:hypothetical protein